MRQNELRATFSVKNGRRLNRRIIRRLKTKGVSQLSTIFKKIIDKELPADIVYEDDKSLAFRDINPVAPTHILVIPKVEIVNIGSLKEEDEALVGHLLGVCKKVAEQEGLSDFRVISNSGAGAGQSVFHLHFHVVGGRSLHWPPG